MENKIVLTDAGFRSLQEILDNPPEPTQALKDLMSMDNSTHDSPISLDDLTLDEVIKTLLYGSRRLCEAQEEDALAYLINQSLIDVKERNTLTLDELVASI